MRIFLSAIESNPPHSLAVIAAKAKNLLTSFFYAGYMRGPRGLGKGQEPWERALQQAELRLADSGAHTFRVAGHGFANASDVLSIDFDAFLDQYIKWLQKWSRRGLLDVWVELDIGLVTGTPWVERARKKFIAAGLGHGLIQVWHSDEHDWDYWLWLLKEAQLPGRSRYVAIEGHNPSRPQHEYTPFIKAAYEQGVKMHAFKITDAPGLKKWPFYSVDSTSWIAPCRFGVRQLKLRTGGLMSASRTKRGRVEDGTRDLWSGQIRSTVPYQEMMDILVGSAKAWVKMEGEIDHMWRTRGVDWEKALALKGTGT